MAIVHLLKVRDVAQDLLQFGFVAVAPLSGGVGPRLLVDGVVQDYLHVKFLTLDLLLQICHLLAFLLQELVFCLYLLNGLRDFAVVLIKVHFLLSDLLRQLSVLIG